MSKFVDRNKIMNYNISSLPSFVSFFKVIVNCNEFDLRFIFRSEKRIYFFIFFLHCTESILWGDKDFELSKNRCISFSFSLDLLLRCVNIYS